MHGHKTVLYWTINIDQIDYWRALQQLQHYQYSPVFLRLYHGDSDESCDVLCMLLVGTWPHQLKSKIMVKRSCKSKSVPYASQSVCLKRL